MSGYSLLLWLLNEGRPDAEVLFVLICLIHSFSPSSLAPHQSQSCETSNSTPIPTFEKYAVWRDLDSLDSGAILFGMLFAWQMCEQRVHLWSWVSWLHCTLNISVFPFLISVETRLATVCRWSYEDCSVPLCENNCSSTTFVQRGVCVEESLLFRFTVWRVVSFFAFWRALFYLNTQPILIASC